MSELILLDAPHAGVARLTLNRPDSLNALTPTMFAELGAALAECEGDSGVRCIALTGAGRAFCAGGDVKAMAERAAANEEIGGSVPPVVERSGGAGRGWVCAAATHSRPRSPMANAIGRTTSGSAAASVTVNPSGTVIASSE